MYIINDVRITPSLFFFFCSSSLVVLDNDVFFVFTVHQTLVFTQVNHVTTTYCFLRTLDA